MRFTLNGRSVRVDAHPMMRLLDALREPCGLTGTKEGCGEGECGACTVLVDRRPVNSCLVPLAQVSGAAARDHQGGAGRQHLPLHRLSRDLRVGRTRGEKCSDPSLIDGCSRPARCARPCACSTRKAR
jgi:carbon-monoxide dehydrogenase small subunit/xanthine dehydrogenase small subunit